MPVHNDNFTGIVPAYASAESYQHLPKLSASQSSGAAVSSTLAQKQCPLPAISTSPTELNADGSSASANIKQLLVRNGHMGSADEEELIKELTYILPFITDHQLSSMRSDMTHSDPHQRKQLDAAAVQRVFFAHFKQLPQHVQQKLFRLFASDPKKPRLINYEELLGHLTKVKAFVDARNTSNTDSPFYQRGDAKLILELELAMKEFNIPKINVDSMRKEMSAQDHQNTGFLSEEEVESVLNKFGLLNPLKRPLRQLLARCDTTGGKKYDWATFLRFLEKAEPVKTIADDVTTEAKRNKKELEIEPGYPMIAKLGTNVVHRAKAPKFENPFYDPSLKGDTRQAHHGLDIHRKKLDLTQPHSDDTNERVAAIGSHSELPPIVQQNVIKQQQMTSPRKTRKAAGLTNAEKFIDELKRMDIEHHGYMPLTEACAMLEDMSAQHQVGLNERFINSAIMMCTNNAETHVDLSDLITYLNAVLSKQS